MKKNAYEIKNNFKIEIKLRNVFEINLFQIFKIMQEKT